MQKIFKLDKNLINQIRAWEVIERPANIVKELLENSIDAHSKNIKIEIKNWWKDYICIIDDWDWISKEDLPLSIEKHATSKIKNINDLFNILTFWFRWEALASISSVSKFSIISKTPNQKIWYKFENNKIEEYPIENWTIITVKELFYNTPARLNYLKTNKTEYIKILDVLNNFLISYPSVWFDFVNDWKVVFKLPSNQDLKTRLYFLYGDEFIENIIPINYEAIWLKISWYITDPKISFKNKQRQHIFVNNRIIKSNLISKSIIDAYNRFIPHWFFPWYVLFLDIDPTTIDVNVHPRKEEIRFENEQKIFSSFFHSINDTLQKLSLIKSTEQPKIQNDLSYKTPSYYTSNPTKFASYSPFKEKIKNPKQKEIDLSIAFTKEFLDFQNKIIETNVTQEKIQEIETEKDHKIDQNQNNFEHLSWDLHYTKLWKIIWQAYNSYILVEKDNKIIFYDQHALAERIYFEKLKSKNNKNNLMNLLIPETIKLSLIEFENLNNYKDIFKEIWFEIDFLSNNMINILSIPDFIKKENLKEILLSILDDIEKWWIKKIKSLEEIKNKILAYTACRASIKFWNKLSLFEINKLLNEASLYYAKTCPHGRSVAYEISIFDLEKHHWR